MSDVYSENQNTEEKDTRRWKAPPTLIFWQSIVELGLLKVICRVSATPVKTLAFFKARKQTHNKAKKKKYTSTKDPKWPKQSEIGAMLEAAQ